MGGERARALSIDHGRPPARDGARVEAGRGTAGHRRRLDRRFATFALAHAVGRFALDGSMGAALQTGGPTCGMAAPGLIRRARWLGAGPCPREQPPPTEAAIRAAARGRRGARPARARDPDRPAPDRDLLERAGPDCLAG